jgi:hypothetical protein
MRIVATSAAPAALIVASWGCTVGHSPVGCRWMLEGEEEPGTLVFETGRPARVDRIAAVDGALDVAVREAGVHSGVGAPIIVEGRLWGVIAAGSTLEQSLPADSVVRLASFTELLAVAIANAESRAALAASRARVVAAADEARRRIERDLHDSTQRRLVSLMLTLRAARATEQPKLDEVSTQLERVERALTNAAKHAHASTVKVDLNVHSARAARDPRRRDRRSQPRPGVRADRTTRSRRGPRGQSPDHKPHRQRHHAAYRDPRRRSEQGTLALGIGFWRWMAARDRDRDRDPV